MFWECRVGQDDALELGDVAWHDGWVIHSAGDNRGQQVRNGLAISASGLPWFSGLGFRNWWI